ncbi:MAG TPA: Flp pilus assembly complex ATPase component TadA [Candidatus Nosocomiicoccus stercorigallinarum]|nr:Flp pilus assembly complex ATPase component TadA [Candidatus Nosocomiicoccus stercorigallinarum]
MEELLLKLLEESICNEYTDIHITLEKNHGIIRVRQFGKMRMHSSLSEKNYRQFINYLKFISDLDTNEHRISQSGRIELFVGEESVNLRISTLPTSLMNEIIVIRLLNSVKNIPSKNLFRRENDYEDLKELCNKNDGLILFTGPTGSGKSTVMFRLLGDISTIGDRQIITIEDPVEFDLENIVQVEINEKARIDYEPILRGVMRCDPDVIMFGEIRDKKIAEELVKASLSGHLVYSTFHSNSAHSTLLRLKEYGIYKEELIESIRVIINQRIIHDGSNSFIIYEYLTKEDIRRILNNEDVNYKTILHTLEELYKENLIKVETYETYKHFYE